MKKNKPIFPHIIIYFVLSFLSFISIKLYLDKDSSLSANAFLDFKTISAFLLLLIFIIMAFLMNLSGKRLDFKKETYKEKTLILFKEFQNLIIGYLIGILFGMLFDFLLFLFNVYGKDYVIKYSYVHFLISSIPSLIFYTFLYLLRYAFSFIKNKSDFDVQLLFISTILALLSFIFVGRRIGMIIFFLSFLLFSYIFISSTLIGISSLSNRLERRITYLKMFISKRRIFMVIVSIFFLFTVFTIFTTSYSRTGVMSGTHRYDYVLTDLEYESIENTFDENANLTLKEVYGNKAMIIGNEKVDVIFTPFSDLLTFFDVEIIEELVSIPSDSIIVSKELADKFNLKIGGTYNLYMNGTYIKETIYAYNDSINLNIAFSNTKIEDGNSRILIKTDKNIYDYLKDESALNKIHSLKEYEKDYYTSIDLRRGILVVSLIISIIMEIVIMLLESKNDFSFYQTSIRKMISAGCKRTEIVKTISYVEVLEFISCFILTLIPIYILFGMYKNTIGGIMNVSLADFKISDGIIFLLEIFSIILIIIVIDSLIIKNRRIEKE